MKPTNKEKHLIKNGKKKETIDFCREIKVPAAHLFWFVDKLEKENFSLKSESTRVGASLVLKMFKKSSKFKSNEGSLKRAIFKASQFVETDESEKSRILETFDKGYYVQLLTYKELYFESRAMRNCVFDMSGEVKSKKIAILALKNSKSKTICHIQVGINGNLEQHYQFANSQVEIDAWIYINKFFEKYKSIEIDEIMLQKNITKLYSLNNFYPFNIRSYLPTEKRVSLLDDDVNGVYNIGKICLKDYRLQPERASRQNDLMSYENIMSEIDMLKNNFLKQINDLEKSLEVSEKNFFILNDDMHFKIFGKKIKYKKRLTNLMSSMIEKSQPNENLAEPEVMRPVREEAFDDLFRTAPEEFMEPTLPEEDVANSFDEDVIREAEEEVMLDELAETEEIDLSLF